MPDAAPAAPAPTLVVHVKPKPFYLTSEFWGVVLAALQAIVGIVPTTTSVALIVLAGIYAAARTWLKTADPEANRILDTFHLPASLSAAQAEVVLKKIEEAVPGKPFDHSPPPAPSNAGPVEVPPPAAPPAAPAS